MSMRITMSMISKQYNSKLNKSLNALNYYSDRATTLRKFSKASEDPVSAVKAYQVRREVIENSTYQNNIEDALGLMTTAESSILQINSIAQEANSTSILQAITDTMSQDDRSIVATEIRQLQESMVSIMNTRYADRYVFGGASTNSAPFTVSDSGELLYHNINVTTGEHVGFSGTSASLNISGTTISFGENNGSAANDYLIKVVDGTQPFEINTDAKTVTVYLDITGGATNQDLQDELRNAFSSVPASGIDETLIDVSNLTASLLKEGSGVVSGGADPITAGTIFDLDALSEEEMFIDIGLGLEFDSTGKIDEQSVFDISLPGISFMGFGTNADGIPNNLFSLLGEVADSLESAAYSYEQIKPYISAFNQQYQHLLQGVTEFGTKTNFLEYTQERMEDIELNLTERVNTIEYIDSAEAIMDYKMQEYTYRAALQMGSQILQPTILDFMS